MCLGPALRGAGTLTCVCRLRLCERVCTPGTQRCAYTPAELRGEAVGCQVLANPLPGAEGQGGHWNVVIERCYSWFAGSCCLGRG